MMPGSRTYNLNIAEFGQIMAAVAGTVLVGAYSLFSVGEPAVKQAIYKNAAASLCQFLPQPAFQIKDPSVQRKLGPHPAP